MIETEVLGNSGQQPGTGEERVSPESDMVILPFKLTLRSVEDVSELRLVWDLTFRVIFIENLLFASSC